MDQPVISTRRDSGTTVIWAAGLAALLAMVLYARLTATPYPTVWPWITFAAMAILEGVVLAPYQAGVSPVSRVVLLAAIIMFRKHPDVIAMVTVTGALAGGFLARVTWRAVLTSTAWYLVLAAAGTAALGLVGYYDTLHFVAATCVLILVYITGSVVIDRHRAQPVRGLVVGLVASLLALAWRTPASGPFMLRLGEVAILAVIGITIGFAMGGRPQDLLQRRLQLRGMPILPIVGGILLVLSARATGQTSTLMALVGVGVIGFYAVTRGWFPIACLVLGAMGNELARLANNGRMPVDTISLPPNVVGELGDLGQVPNYQTATPSTHLAWLADRFPLGPFPGVASLGDAVIALGIVWLFASVTVPRHAHLDAERVASDLAA